jgi:hypothetical protein
MATTIVGEMREGSASVKKGKGTSLTFTSSFNFLVLASSTSVTREEVLLTTSGLPIVGVVYGVIQATCTGISCKRDTKNALYWHVTAEFDTGREDQKQDPSDPTNPDPTTWLPVFVIDSFETKQRILTIDKTPASASPPGPKTCSNSANQPFGEPLTETVTLCSYTFTQFEDASQDINEIMDRNDTVNKIAFAGRDARTLKLNVTSAELGYYASFQAWRVGYRVTYDRDTWDVQMLDVGPNELIGSELVPCMDKERNFRVIGNLDGFGRQQDQDEEPYVITFRTKTEIDFNTFIRV